MELRNKFARTTDKTLPFARVPILKQLLQEDREHVVFHKGKRNAGSQWYYGILSKVHGTDKIAAAADSLHQALCNGVDKMRGRHKKHTRMVSPAGDVVNEFLVNIGGNEIRIRNDRSHGLLMECDPTNLKWILTTLDNLCKDVSVPGITEPGHDASDQPDSLDSNISSKEDRCL
jgi:hypothetical protein